MGLAMEKLYAAVIMMMVICIGAADKSHQNAEEMSSNANRFPRLHQLSQSWQVKDTCENLSRFWNFFNFDEKETACDYMNFAIGDLIDQAKNKIVKGQYLERHILEFELPQFLESCEFRDKIVAIVGDSNEEEIGIEQNAIKALIIQEVYKDREVQQALQQKEKASNRRTNKDNLLFERK